MSNELTKLDTGTLSKLVLNGDLSGLKPEEKLQYYNYRCQAVGLDPCTKPFDLLKLQGKEVLYATKECSAQLIARDSISTTILKEEVLFDGSIYKVTARASGGRNSHDTDDVGAVVIKGLAGVDLCNAIMKATTKAKRRAVLSHCGLGMLDESEIETIRDAETSPVHRPSIKPPQAKPVVTNEAKPVATSDTVSVANGGSGGSWTGTLVRVEPLSGSSADRKTGEKKAWTVYFLHTEDGQRFATFDANHRDTAQRAINDAVPVTITYEHGAKGPKALTVTAEIPAVIVDEPRTGG